MEMDKKFKIFLAVVAVAAGIALVGHLGGYEWSGGPATTYEGR